MFSKEDDILFIIIIYIVNRQYGTTVILLNSIYLIN